MSEQTTAEWRKEFDERMARVDAAMAAATDDRPLAERLDEYLRTGNASADLQAEMLQLQLRAAKDRLAIALTWFRREHLNAETDGDDLLAADMSVMVDALTGGETEAARHVREGLRKDPHYRASLNRLSDWLAEGSIKAILEQGK